LDFTCGSDFPGRSRWPAGLQRADGANGTLQQYRWCQRHAL